MDLNQEVFYTICISGLCWLTCISRCSGNTDVNQGEAITLKCNHEMQPGTSHIGWEYKPNGNPNGDPETIATIKTNGLDPLQISSKQFLGRVDVPLPSGDLILNFVKIQDQGEYICFTLVNGISENAKGTYLVNVLVPPPKEIAILCSDTKDGQLGTACTDIPKEEIKSLSCTVKTKPRSKIQWLSPDDCDGPKPQEFCEEVGDMVYNCVSTQTNVCPGEYTCIVNYANILKPISPAIVVGAVIPPTSAPVTGNSSTTIIVILVILVLIAIIAAAVGYILWKRRRSTEEEQNKNEYKTPSDANPENPPSVEVESPEKKSNENSPKKNTDEPLFIASNISTNEDRSNADENNMQLARRDGEGDQGEEEDLFLSLNHDNRKAVNRKPLPLVLANSTRQLPNQVSMHTRQFFNAAPNLGPNKVIRYKKTDADGVTREFEIETKEESEPAQMSLMPQTVPLVTQSHPIVTEMP